MNPYMVW